MKRLYLFQEIFMQLCCISDLSANFESRWHVQRDRQEIIVMFALIITNCIATIVLLFFLAFANMKVQPYKERILIWRPIIGFLFNAALIILVTRNSMFILFFWCLPLFSGMITMHFHCLLANTIPMILGTREPWEKYKDDLMLYFEDKNL